MDRQTLPDVDSPNTPSESTKSIVTETGHSVLFGVIVVAHVLKVLLCITIRLILSTAVIFEALIVLEVLVVNEAIIMIAAQVLRIRIL